MGSIQRTSDSRLAVKFASSPNPSQSTPSPDLSMKFALVPHRSSYLSPELRIQYEQVLYKEIPQNPHFEPLSHLTDETKQGVMLGWDVAFLTFVRKLQNSADPSIFPAELQTYSVQLTEFEDMGYKVSKLRQRLNVLKTRADQDIIIKNAIHELQKEEKEKAEKAKSQESRIKELEEELNKARNSLASLKSNIEKINMNKRKLAEGATINRIEFKKFANSPF